MMISPGSAVPSGWSSATYNPNGTTTVGGGSITVNGAHAFSTNTYAPGTSIEFVATFTSGTFQNIGFTSDQEYNTSPWVTIGRTNEPDGSLLARASDGTSVNLGTNLIGAPHRYRISWNETNFQFLVDGNTVFSANINMTVRYQHVFANKRFHPCRRGHCL
ncbi:MAG: hypothetical protein WDO16_13555 [Bacteroidota bacterium]